MPSLKTLLDAGGPIYVRNRSALRGQPMKIMLEFRDLVGRTHMFMLPNMKYPVDITKSIPRSLLEDSTDLLRFLQLGTIELVDTAKAQKMLHQPGAQEAIDRAYGKSRVYQAQKTLAEHFKLRVRKPGDQLDDTDSVSWDASEARMAQDRFTSQLMNERFTGVDDPNASNMLRDAVVEKRKLSRTSPVSPRVIQLMSALQADEAAKGDVLADLDLLDEEAYTDDDLGYIIDQARHIPSISGWARKKLAERQPEPPEEAYDADDAEEEEPAVAAPVTNRKTAGTARRKRGRR